MRKGLDVPQVQADSQARCGLCHHSPCSSEDRRGQGAPGLPHPQRPIALCSEFLLKGLLRYRVQPGHSTEGLFPQTSLLTTNVGFSPAHPASATSGYPVIQVSSDTYRVRAETPQVEPPSSVTLCKCWAPVPLTELLQIRGSHDPVLKSSNLLGGITDLWETRSCLWFLLKDTAGKQMGEKHKAGVWGGHLEPPA